MRKSEVWKSHGSFLSIGGSNVFYRYGKTANQTLLCLHGFPTSSFDYHKIWDGLADHFSMLAYDMIGYGFSEKPRDCGYTTFQQVDVLESLIDKLGITELHILAHDYGNTITQELLARREERGLNFEIQTICFMNGALFPESHRPILAQKLLISPIGAIFGRLIPDSRFRHSLASVFGAATKPTKEELDEFMYLFKYNGGKSISHKLIRYMSERSLYRERWVGALGCMSEPFCFINGLADPVSGSHLVKRFRELFPHQTNIVELEGVGHFPHFEKPDAVLKHFLNFQNI